ncbi:MAG: hypothetical protein ABIG39_06465 [Candidatus Micrarchaeota archaeon]
MKGIRAVYFNPGTENKEILQKVKEKKPMLTCSIKALGLLPSDFP